MKKYIICLAFVLLLSGFGFAAPIAEKDKKPIVVDKMCYAQEIVEYEGDETVEGTTGDTTQTENDECENCVCVWVKGISKITKSPDSAIIYATIENLDSDMAKSKEDNLSTFDNVVSALKNGGLGEEDITLEHFSCHPSYDFSSGRNLLGYQSCTSFSVNADNVEKLKDYVDILTENGVSSVYNIKYELSSMEAEYANALASALENAKTKATTLLGSENVKLVSVKEEMVFTNHNLCRNYIEGLPTDLVGKIEVEAIIRAEFSCCDCQ